MKNTYHCPACDRCYTRDSNKQWIKSFCDRTGRYARLQLVQKKRKKRG